MRKTIQKISDLPSIDDVKKVSQGLALLDAIIMSEWEYRRFSFNNSWDINQGEMMASMRDGSGGEYFINFTSAGVAGKVFEEPLADALPSLELVPNTFSSFKSEPAFSLENATFFFWREKNGDAWMSSPEDLTAYPFLGILVDGVAGYHSWAEEYYEKRIDFNVLQDVFSSLTVTADQLATLSTDMTLESLREDLEEIL